MYLSKKIRIVVADDHKLFRDGLTGLLAEESEIEVAGEAENGKELVEKYFELHPDVIVVDISMPVLTGTKALLEIKKRDRSVKALFLSMHDEDAYIYQVVKVGGKGLISKNIEKEELVFAINTICKGNWYFGLNWTERKLNDLIQKYDLLNRSSKSVKDETLSEREAEILLLVADDYTSYEIAEKLELSKRTVDNHRAKIMRKLGLNSLMELLSYAIQFKNASTQRNMYDV